MLPLLLERKRFDDLAKSIVDGRLDRQVDTMKAVAAVLSAETVSIEVLIEGEKTDFARI